MSKWLRAIAIALVFLLGIGVIRQLYVIKTMEIPEDVCPFRAKLIIATDPVWRLDSTDKMIIAIGDIANTACHDFDLKHPHPAHEGDLK